MLLKAMRECGQLGHRDASLTLNTYAHALPDEETDLSYLPGSGGVDVA